MKLSPRRNKGASLLPENTNNAIGFYLHATLKPFLIILTRAVSSFKMDINDNE